MTSDPPRPRAPFERATLRQFGARFGSDVSRNGAVSKRG
jgi:hypothetical protein